MNIREKWIAYRTIVVNEMRRTFRVWSQTLLPPMITTILHFVIFGKVIGKQVGMIAGHSYIEFIAPGLIMLSLITNSYSATTTAFFMAKFQKSIEEILVSPMSETLILCGYATGGILRGLITGFIVAVISFFFI